MTLETIDQITISTAVTLTGITIAWVIIAIVTALRARYQRRKGFLTQRDRDETIYEIQGFLEKYGDTLRAALDEAKEELEDKKGHNQ